MSTLHGLPVELLYHIHLFALSPHLPCVSRRLHAIFSATPPTIRARYIVALQRNSTTAQIGLAQLVTRALCFPMCKIEVVQALHRIAEPRPRPTDDLPYAGMNPPRVILPKCIFRSLSPTSPSDPLPLLHHLSNQPCYKLDVNHHSGYALTKAVYATNYPIIRFLLQHGAHPQLKDCMAIRIAINKRSLELVKMLVERDDESPTLGKRRRLADRVVITKELVAEAIRVDARDIVNYFVKEKGCAPGISALKTPTSPS
ncbi:hypothetical protein BOTBODRAFT_61004 [Botryobasidium botryosum FD-172 SS1]|uniref:Uncharacterized protein n=1 Tax=Botryobasidium botryosum (strain FD-172 SS1) TaxID=930990 RepID=A0A067N2T5_BOTB1|nr:hypothetical protein BOTBODRAFT_61004 [Botryobasidium botryosum FD-172 SS1]